MSVICIGPICVPIVSLIPLLLLFISKFWQNIRKFLGFPLVEELAEEPTKEVKDIKSNDLRRRHKLSKGGIKEITNVSMWEATMKESQQSNGIVIVDFTAKWCQPCQRIAPFYESLSHAYPQHVFLKVDVDLMDEVAAKCCITAMPTFQVFKAAKKVDELQGAGEDKLKALVCKYVS